MLVAYSVGLFPQALLLTGSGIRRDFNFFNPEKREHLNNERKQVLK